MSAFCFAPQTGPMPQSSAVPSRTAIDFAAATSRVVSSAATCSSTITRLVDVHHCPEHANAPLTISATARARSASGNTIAGFLPPSSSCAGVRLRAAASWIDLPTGVEPVNEIALMRASPTSAAPTLPPAPVTQLTTPGGNPLSASSSVKSRPVRGVRLAGFNTTVLPPISAGVPFRHGTLNGKFHGVTIATGPSASRVEYASVPPTSTGTVWPHSRTPSAIW
jgi:hypothetical protein